MIILDMKVMVTKIKTCHLMSIYMITNLLNSDAWIIKSTIAINIFFSKGTEEERTMYLNSDNIKFTSYSEVNEVANELFKPLLSKYQEHLEISKK